MFELFVTAFVMLFLVIDPIGLLPIFISLTLGNETMSIKHKIKTRTEFFKHVIVI